MIYSLNGKLIHAAPGEAVVECGGVGYLCLTTLTTGRALPRLGSPVMLYTYLNVRENAVELFGFATREELSCFRLLTSVSGVGPKVALSILSQMTPDKVMLGIVTGDAKGLKAPGVGPKLAQRLIVELRDKVKNEDLTPDLAQLGQTAAQAETGGALGEAAAALVALGYSQSEALQALKGAEEGASVEELIKRGLRALSGQK